MLVKYKNHLIIHAQRLLINEINDYIKITKYKKIKNNSNHCEKILPLFFVACSGGADSLALAFILYLVSKKMVKIGAIVINHNLYSESKKIALNTIGKLQEIGFRTILYRSIDVIDNGMGIEASARDARYETFDKIIKSNKYNISGILLGHTSNDQAETVLLGLLRGSGTRSLSGMSKIRGKYLRPFLNLRRKDTLDICKKANLIYFDDPTNKDLKIKRNLIRNKIMPNLMKYMGKNIINNLCRSAKILKMDIEYIDRQALDFFKKHAIYTLSKNNNLIISIQFNYNNLLLISPSVRSRLFILTAKHLNLNFLTYERLNALNIFCIQCKYKKYIQLPNKIKVSWALQKLPNNMYQKKKCYLIFELYKLKI